MRSDLAQVVRVRSRGGRYVVQANPGRNVRRRPVRDFGHVVAPFDPQGFHFAPGCVRQEEVLLQLQLDGVPCELLVNVSPLGDCNALLLVDPGSGHPQVLDECGLRAGLALARASKRRDFKIGFNSLRACATVNHYHLQCLYVRGPEAWSDRMAVELVDDGDAVAPGVSRLMDWPVSAWRFRGPRLASALASAAGVLQDHDTPHNVLLGAEEGVLIPRLGEDVAGEGAGLAFLELSGEMLIVCGAGESPRELALGITDDEVERRMRTVGLGQHEFARLQCEIVRCLGR
jgi:hypothetical protein